MNDESVRAAFARFTTLACAGLPRMVVDGGSAFSFRARASGDGLANEGRSERYGAMSLIGLARQAQLGVTTDLDPAPIADALAAWGPTAPDLGDAALVLWSQVLRGDARAEATAASILARRGELDASGYPLASMETGFLLLGLAEALREGIGGATLATLAADVAALLAGNQGRDSDLFSFGRAVRRKNLHRARADQRLGSFASQVYPTMAFAAYGRITGDAVAAGIARACAARLVELQGPEGQWWWVYQTARPAPAVRYPVYTVHQDAMGPMALLAAALADGGTDRYDAAIARSLAWFDARPECPEAELIDDARGVVWRAVQRDDPERTGRLGLGRRELARMGRAAWFGSADRRAFGRGRVCEECRPYHLGWILLADAMHRECLGLRAAAR